MKDTKSKWQALGLPLVATLMIAVEFISVDAVLSVCTATPVLEGEDATLSCYFDQDISSLKMDVQVYIYKDDQHIPVVLLAWSNSTSKVTSSPGYHCNGKITDHLDINISKARRDMAGQYKCVVNPSDVQDSGPCTLQVKGQQVYQERRPVEVINTNITVLLVLGVLSGIITVLFICICIIGCYKGLIFRRNTKEKEPSLKNYEQFDAAFTLLTTAPLKKENITLQFQEIRPAQTI